MKAVLRGMRTAFLLTVAAGSTAAQEGERLKPAVPLEPIAAVLDAFQSHEVVALGDAHGNEQAHAFLLSLIRNPRFTATVNDIVVEFGSARYQDVMDRFVRGDEVPYESLRLVWQNATQASAANDLPTSEEFFRAVRAVNGSLPRERQLRVLLGDPPIDWDRVHDKADHLKWIEMRDAYPAALIQVEVLARERRALLVYGHMHFQRKQLLSNYDMSLWQAQTAVSIIESTTSKRVFTVFRGEDGLAAVEPDVASWHAPTIAIIRGTRLGAADFSAYYPATPPRVTFQEGKWVPIPRDQWRSLRAEDQFDAVLYLGPPSAMTESRWSKALCADPSYMEMRLKRIAASGIAQAEAERLKQYCATVVPK